MTVFGSGDRMELSERFSKGLANVITYMGSNNFLHGNQVSMNDFMVYEFVETINTAN